MKGAVITVLVAILAMAYRWYDYNRFIQIPYWTVFSACYLVSSPEYVPPVCSQKNLQVWSDWTTQFWRWELEGENQPGTNRPILEMEAKDFSYSLLEQMTQGFTQPVVIRGLFNGTAATTKWTLKHFEETYGEDVLIVLQDAVTDSQYTTVTESLSTKVSSSGYQNLMKPAKMKVKSALKYMQQGEKLYISNVDTIFRRNNDLLDDLAFSERISPWAYNPYTPYAAQMFLGFGSANRANTTGTMLHCAASANIFVQAQGVKDWTFVSPRYSIFVYPRIGYFTPAAAASKKPDELPRMHVSLRPGDAMLNPPWMWHEIRNQEGLNIGVATRENHPPWIMRNNWLFSFLAEVRSTPRVAKQMIPKDKKLLRTLASVPFLTFSMGYFSELVSGPAPHPLFTAAYNPCDEHDPNGCTSTMLDKTVYSDDVANIPFRD